MAETVDVVFVHHHTDRTDRENVKNYVPGARTSFDAETARRLVSSHVAEYATKSEAKAAGDPEGPTPRSK